MREYLFKAKRADNDEWIIGSHFYNEYIDRHYIRTYLCQALVKERTIGQYVGKKDKNGKEIFEGDIVSISGELKGVYTCVWEEYNFEYEFDCKTMSFSLACVDSDDIEIIGNIHDSFELIGE